MLDQNSVFQTDIENNLDFIVVKPLAKKFYEYNYKDKRISYFFKIEMKEKFVKMFSKFLVEAILNKKSSRAKMSAAHRRLGCVKEVHFNAFKENLLKAMCDLSFSPAIAKRIIQLIDTQKEDILGRCPAGTKEKDPLTLYSPKSCCSIQ